MSNLRWLYIWRGIWLYRSRTILIILSSAIGIFAFGLIIGAAITLHIQLHDRYQEVNPASATLHVNGFDLPTVEAVRRMPEVAVAEGRTSVVVQYRNPNDGQWHDLQLFALEDYTDNHVNMVHPWQGAWPPPDRQTLLERNSLALTGAQVGGSLLVKNSAGDQRILPIAGLIHDMNQAPAQITGIPDAYVTRDTLEWLGLSRNFNQLQILVADGRYDKAHIEQVAQAAADKLKRDGLSVAWTEVPEPGKHFVEDFLPTILLILTTLGVLALILSGFLVINVITALLTQQTRQIGVMKAIGARPIQIAELYLFMVVCFGLGALLLAIPMGALGSRTFSGFVASQLNFDLSGTAIQPLAITLQMAVGILTPLAAAFFPVVATVQRTVREALADAGTESPAPPAETPLSQKLLALQQHLPLSRPARLALRNTFRRRGRLIRTLIPLTLGGALFMSVLSVRASLFRTLEQTLIERGFDVQIQFNQPYSLHRIQSIVDQVEGVAVQEGWTVRQGAPVRGDDSQGDQLFVYGLPAKTAVFQPNIIAGRWLTPADTNAIVVPRALLQWEPELALGKPITIRIGSEEYSFEIVGVIQVFQPPIAPAILYANQPYLWRKVGSTNRADMVRILTHLHDDATQRAVAQTATDRLQAAGLQIKSIRNASEDRVIFAERFNIVTVVLMVMAFLLATVGSLGLMGTMSINVLERRREIGVLRAIGASDGAVIRLFVLEGVVISVMAWAGSIVLSQPMSRIMSYVVGMNFAKLPLTYVFDLRALPLWLLIAIIVSALSSLIPARAAARLSVRETLAYEG
jgi:putative ABC transport system permease protein